MNKTKVCNRCKKELSIDKFHKNKNERYGVHSICKKCKTEYYWENRERLLQRNKEYCQKIRERLEQHPLDKNSTKICNRCKETLSVSMFYKDLTKKDGLHTICKECRKKPDQEYYQQNKEEILQQVKKYYIKNEEGIKQQRKQHYQKNREKISEQGKKYRQEHKEEIRQRRKERRLKNRDKLNQRMKEYRKKNKEKFAEYEKKYIEKHKDEIKIRRKGYRPRVNKNSKKRYDSDINYKLSRLLRCRVGNLLRGKCKSKSTMELLGCSIDEFKSYLEKQFEDGMTWENYGYYGWHIDHLVPCNCFNLSNPEEQQKCFHFSNLRPLWQKDNISRPKDGSDIT